MRSQKWPLLILAAALLLGSVLTLTRLAYAANSGALLMRPAQSTAISTLPFSDGRVEVRVARAEGKYLVAVAVKSADVTALWDSAGVRSFLAGGNGDFTFDEETLQQAENSTIILYRSGWSPVKRPLTAYRLDLAAGQVAQYQTLSEARAALRR
jgi:hypothetical protein